MSHFTTLNFYRPISPAPLVTGDDLGRFIARIMETDAIDRPVDLSLDVKFGESIDQDDKEATWFEESVPGISVMNEIDWEIELSAPNNVDEMIEALSGDNRHVYRASVSLGMPNGEIVGPITREPSEENSVGFYPDSLGIDIGPIMISDLSEEVLCHVGWIAVDISGGGYLYPWTFSDVVKRIGDSAETQQITDLCREFWPVIPEKPDPQIVELRQEMGILWPYADLEKPWDWYWGVSETG